MLNSGKLRREDCVDVVCRYGLHGVGCALPTWLCCAQQRNAAKQSTMWNASIQSRELAVPHPPLIHRPTASTHIIQATEGQSPIILIPPPPPPPAATTTHRTVTTTHRHTLTTHHHNPPPTTTHHHHHRRRHNLRCHHRDQGKKGAMGDGDSREFANGVGGEIQSKRLFNMQINRVEAGDTRDSDMAVVQERDVHACSCQSHRQHDHKKPHLHRACALRVCPYVTDRV
jgi:hypothetical protein